MLNFVRRVFIHTASGTACFSHTACFSMTGILVYSILVSLFNVQDSWRFVEIRCQNMLYLAFFFFF